MCSVATNLVTSLEVNPSQSATILCRFRQTRSCYVAILSILCGSNATTIGDYVAVPERFGQIEEPASRNEERTEEKPKFVPKNGFNQCIKSSDMQS